MYNQYYNKSTLYVKYIYVINIICIHMSLFRANFYQNSYFIHKYIYSLKIGEQLKKYGKKRKISHIQVVNIYWSKKTNCVW